MPVYLLNTAISQTNTLTSRALHSLILSSDTTSFYCEDLHSHIVGAYSVSTAPSVTLNLSLFPTSILPFGRSSMSFIYNAFHKLLRTEAAEGKIDEPTYIMSGRCRGESVVDLETVPCFCPKGQYKVTENRPSIPDLRCVCGHSFRVHDSSLEAGPRHCK